MISAGSHQRAAHDAPIQNCGRYESWDIPLERARARARDDTSARCSSGRRSFAARNQLFERVSRAAGGEDEHAIIQAIAEHESNMQLHGCIVRASDAGRSERIAVLYTPNKRRRRGRACANEVQCVVSEQGVRQLRGDVGGNAGASRERPRA